jgi:hypothetical protein
LLASSCAVPISQASHVRPNVVMRCVRMFLFILVHCVRISRSHSSRHEGVRNRYNRHVRRTLSSDRWNARSNNGCQALGRFTRLKSAEGVGFEPTVSLHLLRFSRPSQSTTLAPLRLDAKLKAATKSQGPLIPGVFTADRPRPGCRRRRRSARRRSRLGRSRRSAVNRPRRVLPRDESAVWRNTCAREAR